MEESTYIDVEILAKVEEDSYLLCINKDNLNTLVSFNEQLTLRHWDGNKPVVLESYGDNSIRTREDGSSTNNLVTLPNVNEKDLVRELSKNS